MKRAHLIGLLLAAAACGGSEPPPAAPEPPKPEPAPAPVAEAPPEPEPSATAETPPPKQEPAAPIASTPLTGRIEEKAFAVKTALAEKNPHDASTVRITVFDRQVACKDLSKPGPVGSRWVTVTVPWKKDSLALDSANAGIGSDTKGGPKQQNIKSGRAEIVEVPAKKGQKGKIRLKIESAMGDSVEGEAEVTVCE
jgi:hypothetical protein